MPYARMEDPAQGGHPLAGPNAKQSRAASFTCENSLDRPREQAQLAIVMDRRCAHWLVVRLMPAEGGFSPVGRYLDRPAAERAARAEAERIGSRFMGALR